MHDSMFYLLLSVSEAVTLHCKQQLVRQRGTLKSVAKDVCLASLDQKLELS